MTQKSQRSKPERAQKWHSGKVKPAGAWIRLAADFARLLYYLSHVITHH